MQQAESIIFVDDSWVNSPPLTLERYRTELWEQNRLFAGDKTVFRTLEPDYTKKDIDTELTHFSTFEKDIVRTSNTTVTEDFFEDVFAEAIGFEKREYLNFQFPFRYNEKSIIYVDYFIQTSIGPIVFEVNGDYYHNPCFIGKKSYLQQIKRQNFLASRGLKVFRWTTAQLIQEREKVILFLKELFQGVHFFRHDELFEKNPVSFIENWSHQDEALESLKKLRQSGQRAALITQATGLGKTVIAVKDASKCSGKTLFLAHTIELVSQAQKRFSEHWEPGWKSEMITCTTIQAMFHQLENFPRNYFDYIIIDEAHHGAARTYRYLIEYFDPKFLLGLTATPDRMDRQNLEEIFGRIAHSLDITTAIKEDRLVPVRALRINTNISFDRVRVNRFDYTKKDLEKNLIVEERDSIVLETYQHYVAGSRRKTVIFCVSVPHAKRLAGIFRKNGITAEAIYGGMSIQQRKGILYDYEHGYVDVLTSCSVLSEGWDSPVTSVLFMARPTMSKVLYMQQLGRGLRKLPGGGNNSWNDGETALKSRKKSSAIDSSIKKDHLLVVDFVDNFMNMEPAWSVHALFGLNTYRPGDYVCCKDGMNEILVRPDFITHLDLNLWIESIEEIDPFTFEQKTLGMISSPELARELWVSDQTIIGYVKRGKIAADKVIELNGGRKVYFFLKSRVEDIRENLELKKRDNSTLKEDFFEFLELRDYTFSFKIIFLRSLLQNVDKKGIAKIERVLQSYMTFYLFLNNKGIKVESDASPYNNYEFLSDESRMKKSMLINPFEKFERKRFLSYCEDLSEICFNDILWEKLDRQDIGKVKTQLEEDLKTYYRDRLRTELPEEVIHYFREGS